VAGAGFEQPQKNVENLIAPAENGTECGTAGARDAAFEPDLATVVEAWATLAEPIKAGIVAMVRAAK
jgi:hypothetical protein